MLPEEAPAARSTTQVVYSASVWVPKRLVANVDLLLRHSRILSRTGEEVHLVREEGTHFVLPRFYPLAQEALLPDVEAHAPLRSIRLEYTPFEDRVTIRSVDQARAWNALMRSQGGILNLGCGKGKTVLALKKIAHEGVPAVVFVASGALAQQWEERAVEMLGLAPDQIGRVQQDREEWDRPLVIAMMQTVLSRSDSVSEAIRRRFGLVIFDEAHHMSATTFKFVATMFYGMRLGLTATIARSDGLQGIYLAHLGPVFHSDLRSDLAAEVVFASTRTSFGDRSFNNRWGQLDIASLYRALAGDEDRNLQILTDLVSSVAQGRRILVLGHLVQHLKLLTAVLARVLPAGCSTAVIHGEVKNDQRLAILKENTVVFATYTLAKEGLDAPALDTVLLISPIRDWGVFQQCRGRVERQFAGKQPPQARIYFDEQVPISASMTKAIRRELQSNGATIKDVRPRTPGDIRLLSHLHDVQAEQQPDSAARGRGGRKVARSSPVRAPVKRSRAKRTDA